MILTRGRRRPFACGHRGFGLDCHRCGQSQELMQRATELTKLIEAGAKEFPAYVHATSERVQVRGGGRATAQEITGKMSRADALTLIITQMRNEAVRLSRPASSTVRV